MNAEEAIAGIQELSRHFGQGYKWGELEPIWSDLLACSQQAMVRAVGILMKNGSGKRRPDPKYVLDRVQYWQNHMALSSQETKQAILDPDAEAHDAMKLMRAQLAGEIDEQEVAARLFSMSERYGKPSYAMQAREVLARCRG